MNLSLFSVSLKSFLAWAQELHCLRELGLLSILKLSLSLLPCQSILKEKNKEISSKLIYHFADGT